MKFSTRVFSFLLSPYNINTKMDSINDDKRSTKSGMKKSAEPDKKRSAELNKKRCTEYDNEDISSSKSTH